VDLLLLLQDEVDDVAGLAGAEGPAPDVRVWVGWVLGSPVPRCQLKDLEHLDVAGSASAGRAATCSDTAVSGMMRYTYRPSRCRINSCMSSNGAASGLRPVRRICSALANIR
jgi:hypothetical protein